MNNLPSIEGKILEESDIGKTVWYVPNHAKEGDFNQWERGVISSFRIDSYGVPAIFVRYKGCTGERTNSENLTFKPPRFEILHTHKCSIVFEDGKYKVEVE